MRLGREKKPGKSKKNFPNESIIINEVIKENKKNMRKKFILKIGIIIAGSILAGVCAAGAFAISYPIFESYFTGTDKKAQIELTHNIYDVNDQLTDEKKAPYKEKKELTYSDYLEKISEKIQNIYEESRESLVTVSGKADGHNVLNRTILNIREEYGVILYVGLDKAYILVETSVFENADEIDVTFWDGTVQEAEICGYDKEIGMALITVDLQYVSADTKENIKSIKLGNSDVLDKGDFVVAVGSPVGISDSVMMGKIIAECNEYSIADADYSLIITDIPCSDKGYSVILNMEGELIGFQATEGLENFEQSEIMKILPLAEVKDLIKMLSNRRKVSYLGIYGETVEENIDEKMLKGVCVEQLAKDSPAMKSGIQSGDIIWKIDDTEIATMDEFWKCLQKYYNEEITVYLKRHGKQGYSNVEIKVTTSEKENKPEY